MESPAPGLPASGAAASWQERALRAELLAERMAAVLQRLYFGLSLEGTDSPNGEEACSALCAWADHQADLDTLNMTAQFQAHQAADPHCTCPDCILHHSAKLVD